MASTRKSDNAFYRSADLKRPFDNIKEAMGLTGNADSNYYTNLGKVSRYEGSELDNQKKRDQAALILEALASTTDPVKRAGLGHMTNFAGSGLGEQRWRTLPALVEKGESEARQEGQKVEQGDLELNLARLIANLGGGTEDPRPEGYEREAFPWEGGQGEPPINDEVLIDVMQRLAALRGGEHKVTSDPLGKRGEKRDESAIAKDQSVIDYNAARKKAVEALTAPRV